MRVCFGFGRWWMFRMLVRAHIATPGDANEEEELDVVATDQTVVGCVDEVCSMLC